MADDKKVKNPSEKLKEATKIASKAKQQNHVYNDVEEIGRASCRERV